MKHWATALLVFLILLGACFLAFGPNLGSGFILDDFGIINIRRDGGIFANNVKFAGQSYVRPVSWTLFGLMFSRWDASPTPYHLVSILALAMSAWFLWGAWRILFPASSWKSALLPPLLFVFWPSHGEVLCWLGGYPDLFAGLFAIASLWAWLSFCRKPSLTLGILGVVYVLLAIASKESALPLAVAVPLLCWIGHLTAEDPERAWWRRPTTWVAMLAPAITLAAFWVYRSHTIGHLVGGYGAKTPLDGGLTHLLGERGIIETANLFLPFVRQTSFVGTGVSNTTTVLIVWAGLAWIVYGWPRSDRELSRVLKVLPVALLITMAAWGVEIGLDLLGLVDVVVFLLGPVYPIAVIAIPITIYAITYRRISDETLSKLEARHRLVVGVEVLLGCLLYSQIHGNLDLLALAVMVLGAIFLTRPVRKGTVVAPFLAVLGLCSVLSILVVMNLPVGWDGQQERFSYFGSIFSVMAIAVALNQTGRVRRWIWGFALAGTFFLLALANVRWYRVGKIASQTAEIVRSAPSGAHLYFLAAPGVLDGAGLLQIGIPEMPYALRGERSLTAGVASTVDTLHTGDTLKIEKHSDSEYAVTLQPLQTPIHVARLLERDDPLFEHQEHTVTLVGRKPGDIVLYVDASGPHIVN